MKIAGVKLSISVLGDDGEVSVREMVSEVVQAGYEAYVSVDRKFDVADGPGGQREFTPSGEYEIFVRIRRT